MFKLLKMLRFRRGFSLNAKLLKIINPDYSKTYTKLFEQPYFHQIRKKLNSNPDELEPYDLSSKVKDIIHDLKFTNKEQAAVHNKLIEELTKHNFGIATIHSQLLKELGHPLSSNAFTELVKYNPGRIKSSWDLLVEYKSLQVELPDQLLLSVLKKIVFFDAADVQDGKKVLTIEDVSNSCYLLQTIRDKEIISSTIIDKLASAILELDGTEFLSLVLKFSPKLDIFSDKFDDLTPLQTYMVFTAYPFEDLRTFSNYVYNLVKVTGRDRLLVLLPEEKEASDKYKAQVERINTQLQIGWKPEIFKIEADYVEKNFFRILEDLQNGGIIGKDFNLIKQILRTFSLTRCNIEEFMDFYVNNSKKIADKQDELVFEAYLAYSYMAFKTGDPSYLQAANNWLPKTPSEVLKTNVLCVNILINSKFDINKSLDIFNENIKSLNKKKNETTNLSQTDLVIESLVLSYLYKQDIDFARMLLDKAMGEKLFSGKTAVKNIQKHLAGYGEAFENKNLEEFLQLDICKYFEDL